MTELKPCPFCGGEAVYIGTGNNYPKEYWRVMCKKCFASGIYNETKGRARQRWNRRVNNG